MSNGKIIVVEDEFIVAQDLEDSLIRLGYKVLAVEATGEEAITKAELLKPDVMLMDIILAGELDGIQTAEAIGDRFDIPVVYLTSHADKATLDRAKKTGPYGYILKPFSDRELLSTLEIVTYRQRMERRIKNFDPWLKSILNGMGDCVIATGPTGIISFINPAAESMTGLDRKDVLGLEAREVLKIVDANTGDPVPNLLIKTLESEDETRWDKDAILISSNGTRHSINQFYGPIFDDQGNLCGALIILNSISKS